MELETITPREDWRELLRSDGFWSPTEVADLRVHRTVRWDESKVAHLSEREVNSLVDTTRSEYARVLNAVGEVVDSDRMEEHGIPTNLMPYLLRSWEEDHPTLLMRFDFEDAFNGPRLLSASSGDLSLFYETADLQWSWKEAAVPRGRQFNTASD